MGFWNEIPAYVFQNMKPEITSLEQLKEVLESDHRWYLSHIHEKEAMLGDETDAELEQWYGGDKVVCGIYLLLYGGQEMLKLDQMIEAEEE